MLKKITVVLYLIIINCFFTQAEEKEKIKLGLETTSHLSYTGVNLGLQVNGLLNNHSLGIGAKVTFQSSYFPHKNSMGVIIDYKYFLISNLKIKSFISVNYGNTRYEVKNRLTSSKNTIHEYVISNGFLIRILPKIWIGTSMGVGGYREIHYNFYEARKEKVNGYNAILKGHLNYEF